MWSRFSHSSDGLYIGSSISGLSYQSSGYGNSTISTSSRVMSLSISISSMPCSSWHRHQSFLIVFRLFERPILLPSRSFILWMPSRARTSMQPPSGITCVRPISLVRRMSAFAWIAGKQPPARIRLSMLWM